MDTGSLHARGFPLSRSLLAAWLALSVWSCAGESRPNPFTATARAPVVAVEVRNNNYLDVVVYALRNGARQRLGTVTGKCNATLKVSAEFVAAGPFRLQADPVGSLESYVTESIYVEPGAVIVLDVAPVLTMSSWHRR